MGSTTWRVSPLFKKTGLEIGRTEPHPDIALTLNDKAQDTSLLDRGADDDSLNVLFVVGDVPSLRRMLRCEMALPSQAVNLRCISIPLGSDLDTGALEVLRAMRQRIESATAKSPHTPPTFRRRPSPQWKH